MTVQQAVTVTDEMGGRTDQRWTEFGTWWGKVTVVPFVVSDTEAAMLYQIEGPYRRDLLDLFNANGQGIRMVVNNRTLKVIQFEQPALHNRTLIAHCGMALETQ